MQKVFAPGCALMLYKPYLADKLNAILNENLGSMNQLLTCCGDSFYGVIPVDEVKKQMRKRTSEMPYEDVVVYCISCIKAVHIGGKSPHYLVDLLFGEETQPGTYEPELWHKDLDEYISAH